MAFNIQKIDSKIIQFNNYAECYLTVSRDICNGKYFKQYLSCLEKEGMKIIRIVAFGRMSELNKISKTIKAYPFVALGHSNFSKKETDTCNAEVLAVKGKFDRFEYIKFGKKIVGVYFKVPGRDQLYVSGLGLDKSAKSLGFKEEVKEIYESIDNILSRYNFFPQNIHRFWNCMENILGNHAQNYALFNKARDGYFKKHKITDYPASTGIEAKLLENQRINLSLEAIKAEKRNNIVFKTLHSNLQCEAWEYKKYKAWKYGPKFSRAKLLNFKKDKVQKVYVSGTSNVDRKGRSILLDDYEKNISYVISCVEHLLKKSGVSLNDIVTSRLYFKNFVLYKIFQRIYQNKKWTFPHNPLFANICRENFFFEIECIAAVSNPRSRA